MNLDLLRALIEAAAADGAVTEEERSHLLKKAREIGINEADLNFMINGSLAKVHSQAIWHSQQVSANDVSSGFVTPDANKQSWETKPPISNQSPPTSILNSSGFIAQPNHNASGSGFVSADPSGFVVQPTEILENRFTDVTVYDEQGAMSLIQRGKYHGKWLIIKRIKPEFRDNGKYKELFYKEFDNAFLLDHPNIVRLLDKGEDSDGPFIMMEFVDGQTLTKIIKTTPNGIADENYTQKILLQILDALSYVHKKQVYHRDLKPDNILITYKGDNVKILDFGLAAADCYDDDLVKVGTPRYAAPEQMTRGNTVDQRADLYSVGLILLEMLTGQIDKRLIPKIGNTTLRKIIETCTQQKPELRYNNCDEIIRELNTNKSLQQTIPKWLEDRIVEFASDGKISPNEQKVLDLEAKNNNIDTEVIKAFVALELEKTNIRTKQLQNEERQRLENEKAREKERKTIEKAQQARELEQQRKAEKDKRDREKHLARLKSKQKNALSPEQRRRTWRLIGILLIILALIFFANRRHFNDKYRELIAPITKGKELNKLYVISRSLNMRSAPNASRNNVVKVYPYGTEVIVYEQIGKWVRVKVTDDEQTGYMYLQYLGDYTAFKDKEMNGL